MLRTVRLKNFKIWRDTGEMALRPVTLLLGTNSSGKSSLIQGLLLLKQTVQSPDRTVHLDFGGDALRDLFNFGGFDQVLSNAARLPRQFELAFTFRQGVEGGEVRESAFQCSYRQDSRKAAVVQELRLSGEGRAFRVTRGGRGAYQLRVDAERWPRDQGRHCTPERSIAFPAEAIANLGRDGPVVQDLGLAIRRELENVQYLGPLRRRPERDYAGGRSLPGEVGSDGFRAIEKLLHGATSGRREEYWLVTEVSGWLSRMRVADRLEARPLGGGNRAEVVVVGDGGRANLHDVGSGIAQVLPVLVMACSAPPGSMVILEEPETHLHPLAQAVLAELFVEVSKRRSVQFLVETHSEHLFRRLQTLVARRSTDGDQCAMYFVERSGSDASLRRLEVDEFGAVSNWPDHFFGDSVGEARAQAQARAQRLREPVNG